jgi:hypothetical protein
LPASSAGNFLLRLILRAPNGATSIVRWRTCDSGAAVRSVYDLTVENHACYQANGILVSNSDALRYLALANIRNAGSSRPLKYPDLAVV